MFLRHLMQWTLTASLAFILFAPEGRATVLTYDLFKNITYSQTSDSQPVVPAAYFGSASVASNNPTDFTTGTVTSTSAVSPMNLTPDGTGTATFQTPFLGSQAELDADFPNGTTYTYNISGGTLGSENATLSTPASNAYAGSVPFLTNNGFSALQGVNASGPITLTWDGYSTPAGVNTPLIFFGIARVSDGGFVFGTSGSNTLTSVLIPANTLQPGTQYDLDLVYSARISTGNAGFGGATSFSSYDRRTDLVFTTADSTSTPEPSSLSFAAIACVAAGLARRKRRGAGIRRLEPVTPLQPTNSSS